MSTHKTRENIIAMIPARMGSTRLAMKNLALICGRPLIYYAIKAAKDSKVFDRIVLNSEDAIFEKIARRYKAHFYKRPAEWATSDAKSDSVVYDFIRNNPCDIVVWVNPTSPLQTSGELRSVIGHFISEKLDTLITVKNEQVHCVYNTNPVNFDPNGLFAKTQELIPVQSFVYSIMMWRTGVFMSEFEKKGYAFFCGKVGYYPVGKLSSVIIKNEEDLIVASYIMQAQSGKKTQRVRYDDIVKSRNRTRQ